MAVILLAIAGCGSANSIATTDDSEGTFAGIPTGNSCASVSQSEQQAGNVRVLQPFNGTNGANPWGSLTVVGDTLYGRTRIGGAHNSGDIFKLSITGANMQVIYSFSEGKDNGNGNQPHHDALLYNNGYLYEVTLKGGKDDGGVAFSIATTDNTYQVLHAFQGKPEDGANAHSGFILVNGVLYGMTANGGAHSQGSLYSMNLDGSNYKVLYSFEKSTGDEPHGRLTLSSDGQTLWGMTRLGGASDDGVLFRYSLTSNAYTVVHTFHGGVNDGATPFHGFLTLEGTTLYGLTTRGGAADRGVAFSIAEDGTHFQVLHTFDMTTADGIGPKGSLTLSNGYLYGTTFGGGKEQDGTVFRLHPDGSGYTQLAYFGGSLTGAFPFDNVVTSTDGHTLFGMTGAGGANDPDCSKTYGTIFSVAIPA